MGVSPLGSRTDTPCGNLKSLLIHPLTNPPLNRPINLEPIMLFQNSLGYKSTSSPPRESSTIRQNLTVY